MSIEHLGHYSIARANIKVDVDWTKFKKQIELAQFKLDTAIMIDMIPYMPRNTGTFINLTKARSAAMAGTGRVCAGAPPYGRFLYMGKVMVDPDTGSPWARAGAKKVVTDRDLNYSNPQATPKWFETAKANHGKQWVDMVKKTVGGG